MLEKQIEEQWIERIVLSLKVTNTNRWKLLFVTRKLSTLIGWKGSGFL